MFYLRFKLWSDLFNIWLLIMLVFNKSWPQTVNYHTVETMFRTSCWFLVALFFSANCLKRQFFYSRLGKKGTNLSLAVLYGEDCSLLHCAGLCSGDDYCMEFLYSETSRQCLGLHCVKNKSHQYVVPESEQMLLFKKGKSCLFEKLFKRY